MAQTVKILMTDDLDGSEATETVRFGIDGKQFEIDLSTENADKLREAVRPFASKARRAKVGQPKQGELKLGSTKGKAKSAPDPENAIIRKWAQENGWTIGDKGRVKQEIKDAYYASTGKG